MKSHSVTLGALTLGWLLLGAHQLLSIGRRLTALRVLYPKLPTTLTPWLLALALFFALTYLPWLVYCVGKRRVAEAEAAGRSSPVPLALIILLAGLGWQIVLFPQPPRAAAHVLSEYQEGLFHYLGAILRSHLKPPNFVAVSFLVGWLEAVIFLGFHSLRRSAKIADKVLLTALQIIVVVVVAMVSASWFRAVGSVHPAWVLLPPVFVSLAAFAVEPKIAGRRTTVYHRTWCRSGRTTQHGLSSAMAPRDQDGPACPLAVRHLK